jgi:hypothetical protein
MNHRLKIVGIGSSNVARNDHPMPDASERATIRGRGICRVRNKRPEYSQQPGGNAG